MPRSVKAERNAQLLFFDSLEIVVVLLAKCINLVSRMGDQERKSYLHHVAETAPIDACLVVCDMR